MASRARDPHLQLDIRHVLVCFLGIISSVAAQNSIPLVAISAVPEAQTTLPPGELKGTYIASDGSLSSVFCAPGEAFIVLANYAACCLSGVACDFGVECNGSALRCFGTTIFDIFPSPTSSWVDWGCLTGDPIAAIYLYVETAVEITQHVTVTISSGTLTITTPGSGTVLVTRTRTVRSSDIPPNTESTTGPVSSSSKSENNSSTTTRDSAPTSSTTFYGNPVPETPARPASSRAWIAGVVAGPLLALVAVGGLLYWLRRHRQGKTLAESGGLGPDIHASDPPCIQADFAQSAELSGKTSDTPPVCELEATEVHQGPFRGTGGAMRL
ncbi:hypothetical protein B0H65DRAFT_426671 [Neurospora tetraspora]|uniref:Mid2 domain-containing protein n=1 Tax=Neurospora tetraspora TaxID=94610 RepID=A0AAE0JEK8_9PEZI|nr:hypothetical protein B0H65DRAFT_426671 [Neurospora tetraspora]